MLDSNIFIKSNNYWSEEEIYKIQELKVKLEKENPKLEFNIGREISWWVDWRKADWNYTLFQDKDVLYTQYDIEEFNDKKFDKLEKDLKNMKVLHVYVEEEYMWHNIYEE